MTQSRNARHDLATSREENGFWYAYDTHLDMADCLWAKGTSEDIAVSNWWALHAKDEKYPRKNMVGYVAHEVALNPESV